MAANEKRQVNRRSFLKLSIAGLATTAVAGTTLNRAGKTESGSEPTGSPHKWVMVIDADKCVGCGQCMLACNANNDVPPDMAWTQLQRTTLPDGSIRYLPVPCQHCAEAPCVEVCPVGATKIRADGIVTMDYNKCIGCRYCELACPYGARSFNWEKFTGDNPAVPAWGLPDIPRRPRGVVEKCSFCQNRIDRGLSFGLTPGVDAAATPACVVACPKKARVFGDLNDPHSEVSRLLAEREHYRLREELGTEPRVYYLVPKGEEVTA